MESTKFDAIIVGSGMGGMSVAGLLSRLFRKKVLVLEKHGKFGGFTHIFKRPKPKAHLDALDAKYEFDVGIHYVGEMQKGSALRRVMDYITESQVAWQAMPEVYDLIHFPDFRFGIVKGEAHLIQKLIQEFPKEKTAIEKYFKDIKKTQAWVASHQLAQNLPGLAGKIVSLGAKKMSTLPLTMLKDYLDSRFQDAHLKAVLASQWGDHGVVPSKCPFATHAVIVNHYLNGGFYPVGGSSTIGRAVQELIEKTGGKVLLKTEVKRILLEGKKVIGVETLEGQKFHAPLIYSNIGLPRTFENLLEKEIPKEARESVHAEEYTVVTLYVGFKQNPKVLGVQGENHWIFGTLDHEEVWQKRDELLQGKAHTVYVSFPSLKDGTDKDGLHTAEVIAPVSRAAFSKWNGTSKSKRGDDYIEMKNHVTEGLLRLVETAIPGFTALIDFKELSSPLTIEHYSSHRQGSIYGTPAVKSRFESGMFRPETEVSGLYLCGADAAMHGIGGTLISGVLSVGKSVSWRRAIQVMGQDGI